MPKFGLIGYPLQHSFSKSYFTSKFEREGKENYHYINCEIKPGESLKEVLNDDSFNGFNITIPWKQNVLPYLDEVSDVASSIGSINVIQKKDGKLIGHNTDYIGFKSCLLPLLKPYYTFAIILGNGGSSKAVQYVFNELEIDFKIISRNGENNYDNLRSIDIKNAHIIVNTTPLGMFPEINHCPPIPYDAIEKFHLCIDLIYNPSETIFLKNCNTRGAQTINGYQMLIAQAEESWKIWNNQ